MPLQLNCRNLPLCKLGPGAAVLVWAGELGPMERDRWERECPDERVERVRSKSEDSGSLVGASGGTGVVHVKQLRGAMQPLVVCWGVDPGAAAVAPLVAHLV